MWLLDVTRLIRRGVRAPTGIDRVERAYLRYVLSRSDDGAGLIRTRFGYLVLARAGLEAVARTPTLAIARRHAIARCVPVGLASVLRRLGPDVYLNVGHSNLSARVCAAVRGAGGRIVVMVHDTIPLDMPQVQRPETMAVFQRFLTQVAGADVILTPSAYTKGTLLQHLPGVHRIHVMPLGLDAPCPMPEAVPVPVPQPFVLMLGTIEPRKNLDLMLDVWAAQAQRADWPHLVVCGARGWASADTFARLDARPLRVHVTGPLPDAQVTWLLGSARALVFPTLAEGYGLPPLEALTHGTPVLCSDLAVLRETLGHRARFLPRDDPQAWACALSQPLPRDPLWQGPQWADHFKRLLNFI